MNRRFAFAVPGDLSTPTGGYAYDRRIIAELESIGWNITVLNVGAGFPRPTLQTLQAAHQMLMDLDAGLPIVIDGLAFGVMPDTAAALSPRNPLIALVHHPLALESGLSPQDAHTFRVSERMALARGVHAVATSRTTAELLAADYSVPADRITVVRPGTDQVDPANGSGDGVVRLLSVGAIVPRKGYDVLIAALATLPDVLWRLTIAGATDRDAETARRLNAEIARLGLSERVTLAGAVAEAKLLELHRTADLFVLASRFEGYGMAYADAIAHGLPVVGTLAGAIPEVVPEDAGILVPSDDVPALAGVLRRLIEDKSARMRLASAARTAAAQLPTWRDSAKNFSRVLENLP